MDKTSSVHNNQNCSLSNTRPSAGGQMPVRSAGQYLGPGNLQTCEPCLSQCFEENCATLANSFSDCLYDDKKLLQLVTFVATWICVLIGGNSGSLSNISHMSGKLGQYSQCDDLITATLSHNSAMPPTLLRSFFSTLLLIASDVLATGVNIYENGIFYFYSCYYKMERFMNFMMTHVLHCVMRKFGYITTWAQLRQSLGPDIYRRRVTQTSGKSMKGYEEVGGDWRP